MPTPDQVALRNATRQIAQQIAGIDKRLSALERGPQLAHSSVQDAAGNELDVVQSLRTGLDAMAVAQQALAQAGGSGNTNFYNLTTDPPVGNKVGDLWFPPDDSFAPRHWDGTQWVPYSFGATAIEDGSITTPKLATAAVVAGTIDAGAVTADKLAANIVLASAFIAGALGGARVQYDSTGLHAYDAGGNQTVSINADGSAAFTGLVDGATIEGSLLRTGPDGVTRIEIDASSNSINFFADVSDPDTVSAEIVPFAFTRDSVKHTGAQLAVGANDVVQVTSDGPTLRCANNNTISLEGPVYFPNASGKFLCTILSGTNHNTQTVGLPGTYTTPPMVLVSCDASFTVVVAYNITTTNFTVWVQDSRGDTLSSNREVNVTWLVLASDYN